MNKVLVLLLAAHLAAAVDDTTTPKPPTWFQFGATLHNKESDGSKVEPQALVEINTAEGEKGQLVDEKISVGVYDKYRPTTYTTNTTDVEKIEGCVETKFSSYEDLVTVVKKLSEKSLVVVTSSIKQLGSDVDLTLQELVNKKITVAFLKQNQALTDEFRNEFLDRKIAIIENLELPGETFNLQTADPYYAFVQVFSPMKDGTSVFIEAGKTADRFVNLANVLLLQDGSKMIDYCKNKKTNVKLMSHKRADAVESAKKASFATIGSGPTAEKWLSFYGVSGTHIVSPRRFHPSMSEAKFNLEKITTAPCVRLVLPYIDVEKWSVNLKNIKDVENSIPEGSFVIIETGNGQFWNPEDQKNYISHSPPLDVEAARYLAETKKVVAIAFDGVTLDGSPIPDEGSAKVYKAHGELAKLNIPVILNVKTEVEKVTSTKVYSGRCVLSVLKTETASAVPAALYWLPEYDGVPRSPAPLTEQTKTLETDKSHHDDHMMSDAPAQSSSLAAHRWQFGMIISEDASNTLSDVTVTKTTSEVFSDEKATVKATLSSAVVKLTVDATKNKVTTYTQPNTTDAAYGACLEARFIKSKDVATIKTKLPKKENSIVLLTDSDLSSLNDDLYKALAAAKLTVGFFADTKLPADIRDKLTTLNVPFFENLLRLDDISKIAEDKSFFAFWFAFSPMATKTSYGPSLSMTPPRKINLADLAVYNTNAEEVNSRCRNTKATSVVLSQVFGPSEKIPVFPGVEPPKFGTGGRLEFSDHYATHFDSPNHFKTEDAFDVAHLPGKFDHPACIKVSIFADHPSYSIATKEVEKWEKEILKTQIPGGSIVLFETQWYKNWETKAKYEKNFPGVSLDAAKFLVEKRNVSAIGIDSLALDDYSMSSRKAFPTHTYLASKNVVAIVNIGRDLDKLAGFGSRCVMSYLRVNGGTGAQVALFGLPQVISEEAVHQADKKPTTQRTGAASTTSASILAILVAAIFARLF